MRLLNVNTLRFGTFYDVYIPPYAILSHTWGYGPGEAEVSQREFLDIQAKRASMSHNDFVKTSDQDIINTTGPSEWPSGYRKILGFCSFVKSRKIFNLDAIRLDRPDAFAHDDRAPRGTGLESLQWVWIDTCCIDASSSSEVSEAINSMWSWYFFAEECYVYLSDHTPSKTFTDCRWFTRGWTLQELIASRTRIFLTCDWKVLGYIKTEWSTTKPEDYCETDLSTKVCEKTRIPQSYISGRESLQKASIAERMSWAVDRTTTRVEDRFYCLAGLLDVRISPMYGEGRKAFFRLQEEIIRTSGDVSIFFWKYLAEHIPDGVHPDRRTPVGMLAPHLGCFSSSSSVLKRQAQPGYHFSCQNVGVKLWVWMSVVIAAPKLEIGIDNLLLISLVKQNVTLGGNPLKDQSNTIAVIACRHREHIRYYRSRCNDLVEVGKIHPNFPHDWNLANGRGQSKVYVEKECSVQDQRNRCSACFKVDEAITAEVRRVASRAR